MSTDVTAVVPTLGEKTTERAIASVAAQTLPVAEIVVVDRVTPFYAALQQGAARVETPFFIQVDADMVLDPDCVARLRAAMTSDTGITVGQLRDPLIGRISGVKLFRTECVTRTGFRDSIIPDVDLYLRLAVEGWATAYVLVPDRPRALRHTLGQHRPHYTLVYTYATYRQLGLRYRYRRSFRMLSRCLRALRRSSHHLAPVARLALGHGLFGVEERDVSKLPPRPDEHRILAATAAARVPAAPPPSESARLLALHGQGALEAFWELGCSLRAGHDYAAVAGWLELLAGTPAETWPAEASLAHGVLAGPAGGSRSDLLVEIRTGIRDHELLEFAPA